jgi:hypothetical protein
MGPNDRMHKTQDGSGGCGGLIITVLCVLCVLLYYDTEIPTIIDPVAVGYLLAALE